MPTTTPFNNLITFSRGSNATVTGSNGLIQWAPNNLLTFSEQMDNAAWVKSNVTVTANNAAAPDGAVNADSISASGGSAQHFVSQSFSFTAGTAYTLSVFAKKNTLNGVQLTFGSGAFGTFPYANFDVNAGTTAAFNCTSTITDFGNGWYRCTMTATATATISAVSVIGLARDNAEARLAAFSSDGNGILIWGAQLELGSTATTYNPTTVKNLLGFSEAFDNPAWPKTNTSIVTGAAANPVNNLFNAQKLMENTAAATQHFTRQNPITVSSGAVVTLSVYAKAGERRYIALLEGYSNKGRYFDLQTGTVGNILVGAPTTSSITPVGSGWYRCSITTTAPATTVDHEIYLSADGASISYTGDGNSGVYIYGAQLSDSASLDPYVPTPGAAPSSTAFYGPRFDFDPVTLQPRGLLVEEQRTNLVLQSNAFTTSPWGLDPNTDFTANSTASPDGSVNAWKMAAKNGLGANGQSQFFTKAASAITYNTSIFSKAAGYDWLQIAVFDGTNGNRYWFNVRTGTIGTTAVIGTGFTGVSASITPVANGFFRCSLIATSSTATSYFMYIYPSATNGSNGTGNANGDGVFVYGAQIEAGAFATSYIPTVASTVTRSADVATITGQNFAQWFNAAEGAIVISADTASWASIPIVAGYNPSNTASFVYFQVNTANTWNGTTVLSTAAGTVANNVPAKAATAYTLSTRAITLNGGTVASDANSIGTASVLALGAAGNPAYSSQRLNGHIQSIRFIPARAADFQLQGLST